jgi:hypothetical protein
MTIGLLDYIIGSHGTPVEDLQLLGVVCLGVVMKVRL